MPLQLRSLPQLQAPLTSIEGMLRSAAILGLLGFLAACAVPPHRAPVEERSVGASSKTVPSTSPSGTTTPAPVDPRQLPGAENAGKPGYYTVKPGDTLIRIALDNGQTWRDLVKWNNLPNANLIEVGQVLRVVPPGSNPLVSTKPVTTARLETRPLDGKSSTPAPAASTGSGVAPAVGAAASATSPAASEAAPSVSGPAAAGGAPASKGPDDELVWAWPVSGQVIQSFDDSLNKGVDLGGKAGDAVLAAASGRVMYVGSSLRGYGNAIIVKHANDYISVYAHNQTMLVKEDQLVHRGQKIAEMGSSDADQVKLHFEVRKRGKPLDPTKVLPPR